MAVKPSDYEELLAEYSQQTGAIALLKNYRPYLEMLPSMRRLEQSAIAIPLPVVRLRDRGSRNNDRSLTSGREAVTLPCDVALLMCDPEWKIKMGVEIFILIHRPQEDFSDLLGRWRQIQVLLSADYEWVMPLGQQHVLNDGGERLYPLFVLFPDTPERIKRGLRGASLPFVMQPATKSQEAEISQNLSPEVH
ncbi:MAG: hypothetical protein KME17_31150 [Cyanosarcina radialis HA8281-LM2]|jgi:hypothetical protein|nr:hypothetical protein [Cyanosarcina radialis HA8281-LM2]